MTGANDSFSDLQSVLTFEAEHAFNQIGMDNSREAALTLHVYIKRLTSVKEGGGRGEKQEQGSKQIFLKFLGNLVTGVEKANNPPALMGYRLFKDTKSVEQAWAAANRKEVPTASISSTYAEQRRRTLVGCLKDLDLLEELLRCEAAALELNREFKGFNTTSEFESLRQFTPKEICRRADDAHAILRTFNLSENDVRNEVGDYTKVAMRPPTSESNGPTRVMAKVTEEVIDGP